MTNKPRRAGLAWVLLGVAFVAALPTAMLLYIAFVGYCNEDAGDPVEACARPTVTEILGWSAPVYAAGVALLVLGIVRASRGRPWRWASLSGLLLAMAGCGIVAIAVLMA